MQLMVSQSQVNVNDLVNGLRTGIYQTTDTKENIIYTFSPDYLSDYIDLVAPGNVLTLPPVTSTTGTPTPSLGGRQSLVPFQGLVQQKKKLLLSNASVKVFLRTC